MKVTALTGRRRARRDMDVRRGRKLVPGTTTTFRGKKWRVTGAGYERGIPVVHLSPLA